MTQRQLLISVHIWLSDYIGERRSGIHTAVSQDVDKVFKGKTLNQLEMLEQSIKKKLKGGEGVDVGKLLLFHLVSQSIGTKCSGIFSLFAIIGRNRRSSLLFSTMSFSSFLNLNNSNQT